MSDTFVCTFAGQWGGKHLLIRNAGNIIGRVYPILQMSVG